LFILSLSSVCYRVYLFLGHADCYAWMHQSLLAITEFGDYENNPGKELMKPASPFPSFRSS